MATKKLTFKFHLAKQNGNKETRDTTECGKSALRGVAIRVSKRHEFLGLPTEYQCITCLGRAKELNIASNFIDQD
jgi:hypothetical protein